MDPKQESSWRPSKRIAVIGAANSGLITIKYLRDEMPDAEIIAFEKSSTMAGCWGRPYYGFVSTSTKFTTQFACYPVFDDTVKADAGASRSEFFCNDEYGNYLQAFAKEFDLEKHIRFQQEVVRCERNPENTCWLVRVIDHAYPGSTERTLEFDSVVICTGLTAEPRPIDLDVPTIPWERVRSKDGLSTIEKSRVVVMGGGELAVDQACRLAKPELQNTVFLSLQSGIRVSPRYHPIRGVPSDFLRNRLMLSIHESMRNWIGQRFVEARIRYEATFQRIFPGKVKPTISESDRLRQRRKEWTWRLTKTAKDELFNMHHNKSDDFLRLVAEERIRIVGVPVDRSAKSFFHFQSQESELIQPDWILPSIGFRSTLAKLGGFELANFYLGCVSIRNPNLYLVGFARPIIGNIPSMSEMQAQYIAGTISGRIQDEQANETTHRRDRDIIESRFSRLNIDTLYPVEMFPYCDRIAQRSGRMPTLLKLGSVFDWIRFQLAPATTLHYFWDNPQARNACKGLHIYMPWILIVLLWMLKPVDWFLRFWRHTTFSNNAAPLK
jgi:hypothetical protein